MRAQLGNQIVETGRRDGLDLRQRYDVPIGARDVRPRRRVRSALGSTSEYCCQRDEIDAFHGYLPVTMPTQETTRLACHAVSSQCPSRRTYTSVNRIV